MRLPKLRRYFLKRMHVAVIVGLLAVLSLIELFLADKKYGLFTGGFGQSQAVDTFVERFVFVISYSASMAMLVVGIWWAIIRITGARRSWTPLFQLVTMAGGSYITLLALKFQLHSYFSDTMSFALMANLGGGSLTDALLFASNEIVLGVVALLVTIFGYRWAFGWLKRKFPPRKTKRKWSDYRRLALEFLCSSLLLALMVPAASSDVHNGLNRTLVWGSMNSAANMLTDFDGDGYGLISRMPDRFPFDGSRYPLAFDVPGNGIDEDGYGGDLKLLSMARQPEQIAVGGARKNLTIIVMESTRFDVIGKRINGKAVAPNLEAIAKSGSLVAPAFSHVGFTTASLKSIFSGSLEPSMGSPSLFRELKQNGYNIGVFSGQPEDFGDISETVGMRKNADIFIDGTKLKHLRAFSNGAEGSILIDEKHLITAFDREFAGPAKWTQPQFLYFNFQSPHFPYFHKDVPLLLTDSALPRSKISADNKRALQETYWNAVAYSDQQLGRVVGRLKRAGIWDNSIVIITGDHGEDLFEEGFLGHGHSINQRQYGTFLVTNQPGISGSGPIGLSDYRAIIQAMLKGETPKLPEKPVLMMVGELEAPTQIGMAESGGKMTTLRLDTGEACLAEIGRCGHVDGLRGDFRERSNRLVRLWGTARWQTRRDAKATGK